MSCSFLSAPGKSTAVGCHFFFHRIFPTQGSNPGLWHCRHIILPAEAQGKHRHNLRSGFHWGSKPGSSACKADRLTTTLWSHELFRVKLKKVGKTTRTFRCDLNQIPYDYTVEVTNRFKGLDLIECLKNYGWRFVTLSRRQWSRPSPRNRNAKRQDGCLRRPYKYLRKEEKLKAKEKRKEIL